jgi:hypothetical protein
VSLSLSERSEAFKLVCTHLSDAPPGEVRDRTIEASERPPAFWSEFVALASDYLVGPALGLSIERLRLSGIVPALVERHCHAMLRLNRSRNIQLRAEVLDLTREFNRIEVRPLFLKGAAGLLSSLYDDPGERIMGDVDVLVPHDRLCDCRRRLSDLGYSQAPILRDPLDHAVATFLRPGSVAPIDLHREVVVHPYQKLLSARETIERCVNYNLGGLSAAIPSSTHQLLLNIGHAQLNDYAYRYGLIPLRSLLDFARLLRKFPNVDWVEIDNRFAAIGERRALRYHCFLASEALNVETPSEYEPSLGTRTLAGLAHFFADRPFMQKVWFRFVRVSVLLRRALSDEVLRYRLMANMCDWGWWQRHLRFFWQGRA